jgi:hypothetical protein
MSKKKLADLIHALQLAAAELLDGVPLREDAQTVRLARCSGRFVTTIDAAHPTDPNIEIALVVGDGDERESATVFRYSASAPATFPPSEAR